MQKRCYDSVYQALSELFANDAFFTIYFFACCFNAKTAHKKAEEFAIAKLIFTQQLTRFTEAPEVDTLATTLRGGLDAAFQLNPRLRGYVLDEQGDLRKHVVIFVDGVRVRDRGCGNDKLDVPLSSDSTVHILQALSGG